MSQKQPVGMAVAKFDYSSVDCHELNITKGEKLTLLDDSQHWWQVMNARGETGYVPSNYCKKSKQSLFSSLRNTLGRKKSKDNAQPVSCGASSVGTAPSAASGRRSTGASPKPINNGNNIGGISPNSQNTNGNSNDVGKNYRHEISGMNPQLNNSSGAVFCNTAGSLKSNGSSSNILGGPNSKTGQSMSYNVGQQQNNQFLGPEVTQYQIQKIGTSPEMHQSTAATVAVSSCHTPHVGVSVSSNGGISNHTSNITYPQHQVCSAKFSYTPCQPDELALNRGDRIRVLEKSSDGWWRGELVAATATSSVLTAGWFPSNYVTIERHPSSGANSLVRPVATGPTPDSLARSLQQSSQFHHHSSMPSVAGQSIMGTAPSDLVQQPRGGGAWIKSQPPINNSIVPMPTTQSPPTIIRYSTVLTLFPFSKNQPEEMSFQANEVLEVLDRPSDDPDWWRCRNSHGEVGLVPTNYVKLLTNRTVAHTMPPGAPGATTSPPEITIPSRQSYNRTGLFLDKIWYWGCISRMTAESLLMKYGLPGQFLVRDSESHPGDLTVTMHAHSKCRNFKVHVATLDNVVGAPPTQQYHIGQKHFPNIDTLIIYYRDRPIYKNEDEAERLFLTEPFQYPPLSTLNHFTPPHNNSSSKF